ncbi:uncharacterized protein [Amphiura filiformis]|uniref:uncharacterized protein n=1 Tax=Amphiura filiformis TaxID=82378 RepID=UPI003B2191FF
MGFLVFSDMCCWMPIIAMVILALTGAVDIPPISYAWIAVFVLPLNSSLNPYLYTIISNEMTKRQISKNKVMPAGNSTVNTELSQMSTGSASQMIGQYEKGAMNRVQSMDRNIKRNNVLLQNPLNQGYILLSELMTKYKLNSDELISIERQLETAIEYLHKCDVFCGPISEDAVIMQKRDSKDIKVFLVAPKSGSSTQSNGEPKPTTSSLTTIDYNEDSEALFDADYDELDKLIKRLSKYND